MSRSEGILTALFGMFARASGQIAAIALTMVATRFLSPPQFGIFAVASAFVTLARTLLYSGPFEYLMKASELDECAPECLVVNLMLAALSAVVLGGIALASPWIFPDSGVAFLILLLIPSNFLSAFASWQEAQILKRNSVRAYYVITVVVEFISVAMAAALFIAHWGLIALAAQIYIRALLLMISYRIKLGRTRARGWPRQQIVRKIGRWSMSRWGSVIVGFLAGYSGDLTLGAVQSAGATGIYRAANRVVSAASDMFTQPASVLAMTQFSSRAAKGLSIDTVWLRLLGAICLLGWPVLIGLALYADRIVPLVLGANWASSAPVVSLICYARALAFPGAVCTALLVVHDRQAFVLRVQTFTAIVGIILTLMLARWGVAAVAAGTIATAVVNAAVLLRASCRVAGPDRASVVDSLLAIGVTVSGAVLGAAAGGLFLPPAIGRTPAGLAVTVAVGLVGWLVALALVRRRAMSLAGALSGAA
jgi:O-antigen/teichoic acid export membrane protein